MADEKVRARIKLPLISSRGPQQEAAKRMTRLFAWPAGLPRPLLNFPPPPLRRKLPLTSFIAFDYATSPAQAHQGIQKLLTAEHEATEIVKAAKDEKVMRLKQAKAEAEAEIAAYKAQREAQFQVFSKERMGDSAGHSSELAKSTEAELAKISQDVAKNKDAVIEMLLKSVRTVAAA